MEEEEGNEEEVSGLGGGGKEVGRMTRWWRMRAEKVEGRMRGLHSRERGQKVAWV